jgi:hypothetical protein
MAMLKQRGSLKDCNGPFINSDVLSTASSSWKEGQQMNPSRNVASLTRKRMSPFVVPLIVLLVIGTVFAFSIPVHRDVTKETLAAITAQVNGQPKKFSKRALEQVADANEDVDRIVTGSAAFFHPERHFTNESFAASSNRLKSLKSQIVTKVTADPPDGDEARALLGQALHTLQDFYAHSNWIELANPGINTNLGRNTMADPATTLQACPTDPNTLGPNGGGGLTSGYYIGNPFTGCGTLPHPGKCYHGNYSSSCKGINKDRSDQGGPGQHAAAKTVAEAATKDYVEQVLSEIEGNDKAISALLDLKGTLGFIIDDTGSMGPEINGVKDTVTRIVNETTSDPDNQPDNYLLVRFGDPDVGSAFVTQSADALLSAVSALSANGGDDCPELSQTGLLRAIDGANFNSRLYLFTDAGAKDSSLRNEVISLAQEKSARLTYALTGTCSPIDEAYIRGAAETGGQLFFLNQSEIPRLFELIKPQLSGDLMTIVTSKGVLSGTPRMFDVPVDSTIRRLVVSVSIDSSTSISLRRPSGALVNPTDPDAQITNISSGRILTITAPTSGLWRVEISGSGNFSVVAEGNSPIEFYRFDFVSPSGDLHGGFAPIAGQPLAGAEGTGEAAMVGSFATATFKLVSESGETIKEIDLARDFPDAAPDHFVGRFLLPVASFRVVATGNDLAGFPYQRTFPTVYRAQFVGVEVSAASGDVVHAGETRTFDFNVRNLGGAAAFRVNVISSLGIVSEINPTILNLGANASGTVQFNLSVPLDAPAGANLTVTMTAVKTDDSNVFNSAILNLVVAPTSTIQFSAEKYSVAEDTTSVTVSITRSGDTSDAATVEYSTSSGTASDRSDFDTAAGQSHFAAGETQASFVILVTEDSFVEGVETALISLSNQTGATLGLQSTATLEILDDASESATNAIDIPEVYVGQHYHDFLNRQADPTGMAFWTKNITDCGSNLRCIEEARINVSAAFFLSIEFQQTGFFVYRMHEAAFGNINPPSVPVPIRLNDFLRDTQEMGQGIIVGQGDWERQLSDSKDIFALSLVQRENFRSRYPSSTSATDFVNALNANVGGVLPSDERMALILALSANPADAGLRANVIRRVAENAAVRQSAFAPAFVLIQYFGYLRRNPDAAPDTDFSGYLFWLNKLNSFNGDFVKAELTKAFITSSEYRQRFGP